MHTIENRVGRLVELRVESPMTEEELLKFQDKIANIRKGIQGKIVVCTDLVGVTLFTSSVAERWVSLIKRDNPIIERSAVLVGEGAIFGMQVARIIREAGSPSRRAFTSPTSLAAWLGEILALPEQTRLETFLRENAAARARQKS